MSVGLGDKAPDFTLPTDGNGSIKLSELQGKKVVLYFYPKDDTSGCTAEACGFRNSFPDYGGAGAVVIGISKDSVASHDKFKKKHNLPFILASDRAPMFARNMALGSERACTDASIWASNVAPFCSTGKESCAASGTR